MYSNSSSSKRADKGRDLLWDWLKTLSWRERWYVEEYIRRLMYGECS